VKKRARREIRRHKRVKMLTSRRLTETTKGFKVYQVPGMKAIKPQPKKFTLLAHGPRPRKKAHFEVRNDRTGKIVFSSFKRAEAVEKQRELMAA